MTIEDTIKKIDAAVRGLDLVVSTQQDAGNDMMGLPILSDITVSDMFGTSHIFFCGDNVREIPYLIYSVARLEAPCIIIYTGDARGPAYAWARRISFENDQRLFKASEFKVALKEGLFRQ